MTVKSITHPITGQTVRLGRRQPVARGPRLSLRNYLTRDLPLIPASWDYSAKAMACLSQLYDNDTLACCTSSAAFHIAGTMLANAGQPVPFTDTDVIAFYSATSGYIPGNEATDNGADEQTVLAFWQQDGLRGGQHKIAGALAINPADPVEINAALHLFENLYICANLPDAWISPMPSETGFIWDAAGAPDLSNGHAFMACSYGPSAVGIDTWGIIGALTYGAIAKYCAQSAGGAIYTLLSQDSLIAASQKSPIGLDWSQLVADFQAIGSSIKSP